MATRKPVADTGALALWAREAEAAASIATAIAPTAFVPDGMKVWENPEERDPRKRVLDLPATIQQLTAVFLAGQELGLDPMASLRAFVIIRGTVTLYAAAARALLQQSNHEIVVVESTGTRAIVKARRGDSTNWQTATWDLDRAKSAGLYPGHREGNWTKIPKAMLVARATAEACRWVAGDALLGLPPIAEELEDAETEIRAEPEPLGIEDTPATRRTKRRGTAVRAALPAAPPRTPAPHPGQTEEPKATQPQLSKLHAAFKDLQLTDPELALRALSEWTGRTIDSTRDLTRSEMHVVLERVDKLRAELEAARNPTPPSDEEQE